MSERKTKTMRVTKVYYEDIIIPIKKNEARRKDIKIEDVADSEATLILRSKILKLGGIKEDD